MNTTSEKKRPGRNPLPVAERRTGRVAFRTHPDVEKKARRLGTEAMESIIRNAFCVAVQVRIVDSRAAGKALKTAFIIEPDEDGLCATTMLELQWRAAKKRLAGIPFKFDETGTGDKYKAFNGAEW